MFQVPPGELHHGDAEVESLGVATQKLGGGDAFALTDLSVTLGLDKKCNFALRRT